MKQFWENHKQNIFAAAALLVVLATFVWLYNNQANETVDTYTATPAGAVSYIGIEGKTALELLKAGHDVQTQNFAGIGEFVTSIDGKASGSTHFWAFYVNGQMAQTGAGQYVTQNGELIEWKLEEIK